MSQSQALATSFVHVGWQYWFWSVLVNASCAEVLKRPGNVSVGL